MDVAFDSCDGGDFRRFPANCRRCILLHLGPNSIPPRPPSRLELIYHYHHAFKARLQYIAVHNHGGKETLGRIYLHREETRYKRCRPQKYPHGGEVVLSPGISNRAKGLLPLCIACVILRSMDRTGSFMRMSHCLCQIMLLFFFFHFTAISREVGSRQ
jgi:hypothetical protein